MGDEAKKDENEFEVDVPNEENEIEVAPAENTTYNVLDKKKEQKADEAPVRKVKEGDTEIEVVDDTPAKDRGRKPSEPPEELTDEEMKDYSERVQKRLRHMNKGFHDQRRAAEQAKRERDEMEAYARKLLEENKKLNQTSTRSRNSLIEQAKRAAAAEVTAAKQAMKTAYEEGDPEKIADANAALSQAVAKEQRAAAMRPAPLQKKDNAVQVPERVAPTNQQPPQNQPPVDERATKWAENNDWFGADSEMTAFALGYHQKLVNEEKVDPRSDEYYEKLDARMRQVFPDEFDFKPEKSGNRQEKAVNTDDDSPSVVAPVKRSAAPKRYRLNETQVAIAKKLGIPLEKYAQEAAILEQRSNQ